MNLNNIYFDVKWSNLDGAEAVIKDKQVQLLMHGDTVLGYAIFEIVEAKVKYIVIHYLAAKT